MYYDLDLSLIKLTYLLTYWYPLLVKSLKGPVENPTRPSITGGSIEITPTVPLTVVFIREAVTEKYKNVRYKIFFGKNRPTFALYRIIGKKSKFQFRFLNIMLFNFSF